MYITSVTCGGQISKTNKTNMHLNPGRVKLMTLKIHTYYHLTWNLALLGYNKNWLSQNQDNVTVLEIGSLCWRPGLPVEQHYKVSMSVHCHKSVPILI